MCCGRLKLWSAGLILLLNGTIVNGQVTLTNFLAGTAKFKATDGYWDVANNWTGTSNTINGGLPARQMDCSITGAAVTARVDAQHVVSSVQLGFYLGDNAILNVAGTNADMVTLTKMRIGEYNYARTTPNTNPATARLHVSDGGKVRGTDIYVGPARSQHSNTNLTGLCQGLFRIFGGRVACRDMFVAYGTGSKGTLEINGSVADSIEVMDYMQVGSGDTIYTNDWNTTSILKFILDNNGVTPITIYNETSDGGLRLDVNIPTNLVSKNIRTLTVAIASNCVPPNGNITLIDCERPIRGYFTGLKPGVDDLHVYATATNGTQYRWMLTYTGGADSNDLVLTNAELKIGTNWTSYTGGATQKVYSFDAGVWDFPSPETVTFAGTKAFPTAEGFGSYSKGGRGGVVYHVTNLADKINGVTVPGSFRAGAETSGARTIVFDVGGVIKLSEPLQITNAYLTIAGQTAPGNGICITSNNIVLQNTHDIIIRYMRFRPGMETGSPTADVVSVLNSYNCIIDHCSLSWSKDELLSITGLSDLNTVQWSILGEPLNADGHGYLSILGGERSTWSHNVIAHVYNRLPKFYAVCQVDWRDNIIYNWKASGYGEFDGLNFVNNWYKCGTNTLAAAKLFHDGCAFVKDGSIYITNNVMAEQNPGSLTRIAITNICDNTNDFPGACGNNWNAMGSLHLLSRASSEDEALNTPYPPLLDDTYALHAYVVVPAYSGDNKNNGAIVRDATDARIIDEFKYGTGAIKNTAPGDTPVPSYFGSAPTDPARDTDRDGMEDVWENANLGSTTNLPSGDRDNDGYTNIEEYLNSLVTANH